MRKALYALFITLCAFGQAQAAPGDTTWVQAHNNIQLNSFGRFDAAVTFPSGSVTYRKIYMEFTMGTYACPAGSQYCHQWDYTVLNYLMTPGGDTLEMSRFITPYANTGVPRFPANWKHRYIFDVTDYYPLLKNNAAVRIFYSGYSWGFTANVRFAFIEGTPDRNVLGITKLWSGSWDYGKASDPIDNHVTSMTRTAPAGTQAAELKFLVTGHGSDGSGCCEFLSKNYQVKVNGSTIDNKAIWRSDCGSNELYPQGGTWVFDRGNWCPGAIVDVINHPLTGVTAGTPYTADVDFDPYTTTGTGQGSYSVSGNVIYYAGFNKTVDASLESITAPTDHEAHFRQNPSSGRPVVTIRNTGSSPITSMQIRYGVKDSAAATYTWSGSLAPLADTQITLPELTSLRKLSLESAGGTQVFIAQITSVNGAADNDATNDMLTSSFTIAPTWPNAFEVYMKTNSEGVSGIGQNPSETSWKITDANGNIIASRTNADVSTVYSDTVSVPTSGFYKLTVTDGGCDGLHWWLWDLNPGQGITAGNIVVRNLTSGLPIPVKGNTYGGTYHDDFGCGFEQNFTAIGWPAGVSSTKKSAGSLQAFPNPARNTVTVALYGLGAINGEISIVDAIGKTILTQQTSSAKAVVDVQQLASGIYNIIYTDASGTKVSSRLTISK